MDEVAELTILERKQEGIEVSRYLCLCSDNYFRKTPGYS